MTCLGSWMDKRIYISRSRYFKWGSVGGMGVFAHCVGCIGKGGEGGLRETAFAWTCHSEIFICFLGSFFRLLFPSTILALTPSCTHMASSSYHWQHVLFCVWLQQIFNCFVFHHVLLQIDLLRLTIGPGHESETGGGGSIVSKLTQLNLVLTQYAQAE
jgi:hypothetical protein